MNGHEGGVLLHSKFRRSLSVKEVERFTVPPNLIPLGCETITPDMLPLAQLEPEHIQRIVRAVPGGARNVQDIYPLTPTQEGMLFHHMLGNERDAYLVATLLEFQTRDRLDGFIEALQQVVSRHDVLRTAILWEELPRPMQVVYRHVSVPVEAIALDRNRAPAEQVKGWVNFEHRRLDLRKAPLLRLKVAADPNDSRWYALLQQHHIASDHESLAMMCAEVKACLEAGPNEIPPSVPYRNHVAQSLALARTHDAEEFFRRKLGDIEESTAPFGVVDVHGDGSEVEHARQMIEPALAERVRAQARRYRVSVATLFHAAWGLVMAHTAGRESVVYGTVLFGRLRTGAKSRRGLGLFLSTLPFRLHLHGLTTRQLVERTQQELHELLDYEQSSLVIAQRCSGIGSSAPLFTALLNYRQTPVRLESWGWAGIAGIRELVVEYRTNYPITLSVDDFGKDLEVTAQTDRRIDPRRMAAYLITGMQSLVEALERAPQTHAVSLSILPESERRQVLALFNDAGKSCPQDKLVHELFEEHVRRTPGAVALVYEGDSLTYGELNAKANQLARYLRERGVGSDQLVAICVERSLEMVVGLLGILKAGGAYVPLDPRYPLERLQYLLDDAAPKVLLTQVRLRESLPRTAAEVIALDEHWSEIAQQPCSDLDARALGLNSDQLAYVIYTSGSTGQPKGAMVEHRNVTRLFTATAKWFGFNERDVWTLFHSFAFDFSVWELWGALLYGGRVVIVPHLTTRSPQEFYRLVCAQGVTVLNQTPSAFAQLISAQEQALEQRHSLRVVIFGGEALELHTLRPWVKRNGATQPQLVNMYGITETTVHVTYRALTEGEIESERGSLIGRPIEDLTAYLLDARQQPVPIGVAGEIYIGGAGVARGYLNRPQLTAERFIKDPFTANPQGRLYKSGDLGRWRADGSIEYLGRNDSQVKIRGFRIELGEIEAQLARHAQVKEAVVIAREDIPGEKRLVAYVTLDNSSNAKTAPEADALRAHLSIKLPEYMVPSAFVKLERLPLTLNGKLNRQALPVPEIGAYTTRQYVAPNSELERRLCEIWADALGRERVGIHDNFFSIGGDSILSLRVLTRAKTLGVTVGVADLFRYQTVAQLASAILLRQTRSTTERKLEHFELLSAEERAQFTGVAEIEDAYPLSLLQEGMYFHSELTPGSAVYHDVFSYCVESAFHREYFDRAMLGLVQRHPILRTAFRTSCEYRLLQIVHKSAKVVVQVEDISHLDPREQDSYLQEWIGREKYQRFTWSAPPLLRVMVHVRAVRRFQYSLSFHHAILDGWSVASLQTELLSHYSSLILRRERMIAAPVAMYRDFISREREALLSSDTEQYWRILLEGAGEPLLPKSDYFKDELKGHAVATYRMSVESELSGRLEICAQQLGVHLKLVLLAAHVKVMSLICGERSVLTGLVSHGRLEQEDGERVLGLYLNTLPVRVEVLDSSWRKLVIRLRNLEEAMLPHRHYPLAAIQKLIHSEKLFDTVFNFVRFHVYRQVERAVEISDIKVFEQTNFSLMANFVQELDGPDIALSINFDPAVFSATQVERIGGYYERAFRRMVEDIDACHGEATLLSDGETDELLVQFNRTERSYPCGRMIHELFEEQVDRAPNSVAVICDGQSLSYAELNAKSNQLARYLREKGVGPDQRVGICIERSLEMVVGLLGVLKAGGAYVPLDPAYPAERLAYMINDAAPCVLLTQQWLKNVLPSIAGEVVALDKDWGGIAERDAGNLDSRSTGTTSRNLAYVIYTSGSTGRPKGVMVEHSGVVNFLTSMQENLRISVTDCMLAVTTVSFDIAALELYLPLVSGAKVLLASREAAFDEGLLITMLEEFDVSILQATPATWQLLLTGGWSGRSSLKALCGGEALTADLSGKLKGRVGTLWNLYGPTETTIWSCSREISKFPDERGHVESVGRPIANTRVYILDSQQQAVPTAVIGEIYISGAGVARGYLKRPDLTAERFFPDPFSAESAARMYKTGDTGRWRPDGTIEYLGRNDHQVKIRGFRIELGEIEAQLAQHKQVKQATVIAREDTPGDKRLVAYVIARESLDTGGVLSAEALRAHLRPVLPEYMVPSAFVMLERLPLTPNGKLDQRALPAPELRAYVSRQYEAPQGEIEEILAGIWQAVLRVERVGRQDNFFELGGHSLLIVQMLERLRRVGLSTEVRRVFDSATLADLASTLGSTTVEQFAVPPNLIPPDCEAITPPMLTLVELEAAHIEQIVQAVPGGAANIQDIYPLAPLQEGILFHHLLDAQRGDTYIVTLLFSALSQERLEKLIAALQAVIDRHDVLRTAVLWEQLPQPVQVVYRRASLSVEAITLVPGQDPIEQLKERMRPERQRLDLRQAPLLRLQVAADPHSARRYALLQLHHITCDRETVAAIEAELIARFEGRELLPLDSVPYRNHVSQVLAYGRTHDTEGFFRSKLGDIEEPTAAFGLVDVHGDGSQIEEAHQELELTVSQRLRAQARRLGVSAATLFHAALALVLAGTSGRDDVVYGTVLLGRLQGSAGAQRTLGLFINTLPLRLPVRDVTAKGLVERTQRELVELLSHEQSSLALAQRCSGVAGSTPLFSTLLNYRHSTASRDAGWSQMSGIEVLAAQERTNYPIMLAVDDQGEGFAVTAQTDCRIDPRRMVQYVCTAARALVGALEEAPQTPALSLSILPAAERHQVIELFNATEAVYPREKLIHGLFEEQVERTPDAVAVACDGQSLTYAKLNGRANQLARHLKHRGVGPDRLVGICVERSVDTVTGLLGILKAGGAYVPLDPNYPGERLAYMLADSAPHVVLTQERLKAVLPPMVAEMVALDEDWGVIARLSAGNLDVEGLGLCSRHLAYVIYTSGSTGVPKGVMVEHAGVVNLLLSMQETLGIEATDCLLGVTTVSFDICALEIYLPLISGAKLVVADRETTLDARRLKTMLESFEVTVLQATPTTWQLLTVAGYNDFPGLKALCGGEALATDLSRSLLGRVRSLWNLYGPTETTIWSSTRQALMGPNEGGSVESIGRPIANTQIYILDRNLEPVPVGVTGEIYIGGAGVARGYLKRPELTAERFVPDPFSTDSRARLYRTGDLGRWRADGNIEYQGRNDGQVKIRGFRIEVGEIEARLRQHPQVNEAVVVAREDAPREKRLVAYVVPQNSSDTDNPLSVESLRGHLKTLLPEYMVPSAFVTLESLPLTPNGKLDRRALPRADSATWTRTVYKAPQGRLEETLADIWQKLLQTDRMGRDDDFFEFGGHSLLGMKFVVMLTERLGVQAPIVSIFQCPTIRQMGRYVSALLSEETGQFELASTEELEEGVL